MYYSHPFFFVAAFAVYDTVKINSIAAIIFGVVGSWYVLFEDRGNSRSLTNRIKNRVIGIAIIIALLLTWPLALSIMRQLALGMEGGPLPINLWIKSLIFLPLVTLFIGVIVYRTTTVYWIRWTDITSEEVPSLSLFDEIVITMLLIILFFPTLAIIAPRLAGGILEQLTSRR